MIEKKGLNYSNEREVRRHLAKIEKRRKDFNEWFHEFYGKVPTRAEHRIIQQHAAWEGWKASLDRFETRRVSRQRKPPVKRCKRCRVPMEIGVALENKFNTSNDPLGGTVYQTTESKMIDCYKCPSCGHSEKEAK